MKHVLIGLTAMVIASAAAAEGAAAPDTAQAQPAPVVKAAAKGAVKAPASKQKRPRATKRSLPGGDLRHCLGLKTNEEIIKCSEKR